MTGEAPASFHVTSAFDEVRIETLAHTSEAAAHAALEVAHGLHEGRAGWLSVPVRVAVLKRFAALVGEQAEALARQAAA